MALSNDKKFLVARGLNFTLENVNDVSNSYINPALDKRIAYKESTIYYQIVIGEFLLKKDNITSNPEHISSVTLYDPISKREIIKNTSIDFNIQKNGSVAQITTFSTLGTISQSALDFDIKTTNRTLYLIVKYQKSYEIVNPGTGEVIVPAKTYIRSFKVKLGALTHTGGGGNENVN